MRQRTVTAVVMIGSLSARATVAWRRARLPQRTGVPIQSPTSLSLLVTVLNIPSLSFRNHEDGHDPEYVCDYVRLHNNKLCYYEDEHNHKYTQGHGHLHDYDDAKHIRKGAVPAVAVDRRKALDSRRKFAWEFDCRIEELKKLNWVSAVAVRRPANGCERREIPRSKVGGFTYRILGQKRLRFFQPVFDAG